MKNNPFLAEALGTFALVSGRLEYAWLYLAAPIIGMLLPAPFCRWVQGDDCCSDNPAGAEELNP